jgi:hypothetical protein
VKLLLEVIESLVDRKVSGLRRVMYVHQQHTDESCGPIELSFEDGYSFVFDAGPDGESLEVKLSCWIDPFLGEQSSEDIDFVQLNGKWTAFEVIAPEPLSRAIGKRVLAVTPLWRGQKIVGCCIVLETLKVTLDASFDELFLQVSDQ